MKIQERCEVIVTASNFFKWKRIMAGAVKRTCLRKQYFSWDMKVVWVPVWWKVGREQSRQSKSICQVPDLGKSLVHSASWQKSLGSGGQTIEDTRWGQKDHLGSHKCSTPRFSCRDGLYWELDYMTFMLSSKTVILQIQEHNLFDVL